MARLDLRELETIFRLVIEKLKQDGIKDISINIDEYWFVSTDEWDNFSKTPDIIVGSLVEDINNLKSTIKSNEIISYTDFDRLASVLRGISELQAPT
jgi:hypothetical protein